MQQTELKGHLLLIGTLAITLVIPLTLIVLSYLEIITGTADYIIALAVIVSSIYIISGAIYTMIQDKKDAVNLQS